MGFKKMQKTINPPRHWVLVGYPGAGKSTFAMQMVKPALLIDADGRGQEVLHLADGDIYQLSDTGADNTSPQVIAELLNKNMPGSSIETIIVDSLTAIISPIVTKAIADNDAGKNTNRVAAFKDKAIAMRTLQDAVTKWHTASLWIYHLHDARDNKAQKITRTTLSQTERTRLYRSINLELQIVQGQDRRGVKVLWARAGRQGMTLWDDSGRWVGMPEKIEAAVYDGLTEADREAIEQQKPLSFAGPEQAIAWAIERGAFDQIAHATNAYEKVKRETAPANAREMFTAWIDEIERRLSEAGQPEDEPAPEGNNYSAEF